MPAQKAVQCAHAAFTFAATFPELTSKWLKDSSYLVLVEVPDEDALDALRDQAIGYDSGFRVAHVSVYEPDLNDELTAIALEPSEVARKLCSSLPLILKSEAAMV